MATIDKAAIAFSIAIVAVGVGFAFYGGQVQDNAPAVSTPAATKTVPTTTTQSTQFGADIAAKVKQEAPAEKKVTVEDNVKMEETKTVVPAEEPAAPIEKSSTPQTVSVTIPSGNSSPGCETSNTCFVPSAVTINVGDTVEWTNTDTAAHTVTSGSPADGPSGVFDSSLIMAKAAFSQKFDKAGSYDYFCMVHPWMTGNVKVN
ncbi:MAG TPA: plastocyanin/azurin family copper-binding protein [Nitrosarchaeum sp.]|jgi:plastocyanin|nr:plastocyanin/azurin family copper-binding protein [Nitrosarchaeum sp.]